MKTGEIDRRAKPQGALFSDWTAADGWRLRVMDWPAEGDVPSRGSLLFLGGRGDFIEKYLEAMDYWRRTGWRVAAFDWRGQGGSEGERGAPDPQAGFDPLIDDLAAFVREWREGSPGPHVVIAHSMGGHLLLRALAEKAVKADAVVLVAPMVGINSGPVPASIAPRLARLLVALGRGGAPVVSDYQARIAGKDARRNRLTSCPDRYADELWWQKREPAYDLGIPTWNWVVAAYRSIARLTAGALASIQVPMLILAAEKDGLVSTSAIRKAAVQIRGAELIVYPDAAHEILRESDRVRLDAFARIDVFFDRQTG
ncbi:alpha/beta fold hydrolase [Allosphingosinicella vermicomposti]|uniref:alpha/beta fold hydrolase n=1 Tax=Allosphingosinicella vermicomposti TaxID=614671 RepID=UPI001FE0E8B7|nr:alpha/beta hydrolase [Allosphingosinicella vermicomposti]